ncbi:hypothetical protein CHS0354_015140, partial [Potamilus streckersoni]
ECTNAMSVGTSGPAPRINRSMLFANLTTNHTKVHAGREAAVEGEFLSKLEPWEDNMIGSYLLIIGSISMVTIFVYSPVNKQSILGSIFGFDSVWVPVIVR